MEVPNPKFNPNKPEGPRNKRMIHQQVINCLMCDLSFTSINKAPLCPTCAEIYNNLEDRTAKIAKEFMEFNKQKLEDAEKSASAMTQLIKDNCSSEVSYKLCRFREFAEVYASLPDDAYEILFRIYQQFDDIMQFDDLLEPTKAQLIEQFKHMDDTIIKLRIIFEFLLGDD